MNKPIFFVREIPLSDDGPKVTSRVYDVMVRWEWGLDDPEFVHAGEDQKQAEDLAHELNEAVKKVLGDQELPKSMVA